MKKILLLIIIFSVNHSFGQKPKVEKLLLEGNRAFQNSDFEKAKQNYNSIIQIDSTNTNALYNLAIAELNLGNINRACELLHSSYSFGDFEAYDLIQQYCDGLEYSEKMFPFHVDELPNFQYENIFKPLVVNKKQINPDFIKLLKSELKESKKLKRIHDEIFLTLNVDINGNLQVKIGGKISEDTKIELINILKNMTVYKPAVYKGKNVELFGGGFALPIKL